MAHKKTKQRGGGKKKALLSTVVTVYSPDNREEMRKAIVDALLVNQESWLVIDGEAVDLETYLVKAEETAKSTLKKAGLPTTWKEIRKYTNNYDLPINASYAADIFVSIHKVSECIRKGDAVRAAAEGIKLGRYVASSEAESASGDRESGRTSKARNKKAAKVKARRTRMREIAIELFGWKPGIFLTSTQMRELNKKFLLGLDFTDRPTSSVRSADALAIGLREKK